MGSWELNVEKSTFDPAEARVRTATRSYARAGKRIRTVWDVELAAGATSHGEYSAKCDSKPYLAGASETVSCKQVNARKVEGAITKNGTVTRKYEQTVSKDGETMTMRFFAPNRPGIPVSVLVYERRKD